MWDTLQMPLDIVFRDATVVDGTGAKKFVADVAVEGGRIARDALYAPASKPHHSGRPSNSAIRHHAA